MPKLPQGATGCWSPNGFDTICYVPSWMCFVGKGKWEAAQGGDCPTCGGKPISLITGNTYIVQHDFALPGLGGGLSLTRTWNSMFPTSQLGFQTGMFGKNWTSTYEERLFLGSDGLMKFGRGTGSFWTFGYDSNSADGNSAVYKLAAPQNAGETLLTTWGNSTIVSKDGTTRTFDQTSGSLLSIADRNGNTTTLNYDGQNRLSTVSDPTGRTITFNYPDNRQVG